MPPVGVGHRRFAIRAEPGDRGGAEALPLPGRGRTRGRGNQTLNHFERETREAEVVTFTWEAALAELDRRRALSRELGGERRVTRQREQGRLTIRERIAKISQEFSEVGEFAAFEELDAYGNSIGMLPSSYVCGLAKVDGRTVALGGEDFTVRGGAPQTYLDRMKGGLGGFVEDLAHEYKIPLMMFLEGI